jgi:hypothetical protein
MNRLKCREQRFLLDFLQEIYRLNEFENLVRRVVALLPKLIGADAASYHEVDMGTGQSRCVITEPAVIYPCGPEVFEAHLHEHPLIGHGRKTPDPRALKIRDVLPPRDYHRTGLYNEIYRPVGLEYDLTIQFQTAPTTRAGLTLRRASKDFSEHERWLLNLLRPHLLHAFSNAQAWTRLQRLLFPKTGGPASTAGLTGLTPREADILIWLVQGKTNGEIGQILNLSPAPLASTWNISTRSLGWKIGWRR